MHADEKKQLEGVAAAILNYLQAHPVAADSADGVARWWLGSAHTNVTVEQVERAMDILVSRRAMSRLKLMDGTVLYSQPPMTWQ